MVAHADSPNTWEVKEEDHKFMDSLGWALKTLQKLIN